MMKNTEGDRESKQMLQRWQLDGKIEEHIGTQLEEKILSLPSLIFLFSVLRVCLHIKANDDSLLSLFETMTRKQGRRCRRIIIIFCDASENERERGRRHTQTHNQPSLKRNRIPSHHPVSGIKRKNAHSQRHLCVLDVVVQFCVNN